MRRYYEILKLRPGASLNEIKQAYKKSVQKWHPDRFPENNPELKRKAHDMFLLISEAYSKLENFFQDHARVKFAEEQPKYPSYDCDFERDVGDWTETVHSKTIQFVTREWANGDKYEGMLQNKVFHGRGIFTFSNGDIYMGEFRFGKMEGQGKMKFADGGQYIGSFTENQMDGRGKLIFSNGDHYIGQFAKDQFHGDGILVNRKKVYAGRWHYGGLL